MKNLNAGAYPLQFGGSAKHTLKIKSLYDAMAECSCGWHYVFTGERTSDQIKDEYYKHI